ncbi:protein ALTERED PHOSPHATE STARVATION RESPONSE 1-like isoform X2 [Andrographis paniculata]|nr:protein ALTERED PHOSPHATE STARVATION RESPONSE 1-like isoform X2 [Andrographis paniculata]
MGCWYSKLHREQMISRCKARKRYMKQFVKARQAFSAAHSLYLRSLRATGSALLRFATAETTLHHLRPPVSSQIPELSSAPCATNSTTKTSTTPPPPPPVASPWDFWDPFTLTTGRSMDEGVWNESAGDPEVLVVTASPAGSPSADTTTEKAVVISSKSKDLAEIIKEVDDYFLKAANAGTSLSLLLDVPISGNCQSLSGKNSVYAKGLGPLLWTWGSGNVKWNAFGKFCEDYTATENKVDCLATNGNDATHSSTVERLYTWEKKLYQEVKNAEFLKSEHDKKIASLRKLEMKGADYLKTDKVKKEAEKLESQSIVSLQAIETISTEIIKLRESELYPQLLQLVAGLMNMWKSMHEAHQFQMSIIQQLKCLNCIPSSEPTSEIHRQSTLQLEHEAQQWLISFCNLIKSQRNYIQSLSGWLRLSLFQLGTTPHSTKTKLDDAIYDLCEEWQLAMNNAPEKTASDGIKTFLLVIHDIAVRQADEQKQKRKSESAFKELDKKADDLRSLETKHGLITTIPETIHETTNTEDPARVKGAKMVALRAKAEEERAKYEKLISETRASTMSNLPMGLLHVIQAMSGFANSSMQAFESVHNQAKSAEDLHNS